MGYDLSITKGSVRLAEAQNLVSELLEFAAQMELEVIPVNWIASGFIPDHLELLRAMLGDKEPEEHLLVSRPVVRKTLEQGKELPYYAIEREHIQGIVLCHHYEEWILTWNVTRNGLLGRYYHFVERETRAFFGPQEAISPRSLMPRIEDFLNSEPIEVSGEFGEDHINIHCPWRRGDAAAACDLVKLLSRHSDGLEAWDGMGVWPNKDFAKWSDFIRKWTEFSDSKPVHPDAADGL